MEPLDNGDMRTTFKLPGRPGGNGSDHKHSHFKYRRGAILVGQKQRNTGPQFATGRLLLELDGINDDTSRISTPVPPPLKLHLLPLIYLFGSLQVAFWSAACDPSRDETSLSNRLAALSGSEAGLDFATRCQYLVSCVALAAGTSVERYLAAPGKLKYTAGRRLQCLVDVATRMPRDRLWN